MENVNVIEDKRRYKRVESRLPVEYKDLRKGGTLLRGALTRNVGEGGICFQSNEFMSLACRLVVEITLPNVPKPIKAISKVAWIRRVPSSDLYELGNQFLEMAREDRAHITNFVSKVLNPSI